MRQGLALLNLEKSNVHGVILAQKLYNPLCKSDDFLSIVLIERSGGSFVVWTHNAEAGGFSGGSYFDHENIAWEEFNRRGYTPGGTVV